MLVKSAFAHLLGPGLKKMFDAEIDYNFDTDDYVLKPKVYGMGFRVSKKFLEDNIYGSTKPFFKLKGYYQPWPHVRMDYMKQTKKELIALMNKKDRELQSVLDELEKSRALNTKIIRLQNICRALYSAVGHVIDGAEF